MKMLNYPPLEIEIYLRGKLEALKFTQPYRSILPHAEYFIYSDDISVALFQIMIVKNFPDVFAYGAMSADEIMLEVSCGVRVGKTWIVLDFPAQIMHKNLLRKKDVLHAGIARLMRIQAHYTGRDLTLHHNKPWGILISNWEFMKDCK